MQLDEPTPMEFDSRRTRQPMLWLVLAVALVWPPVYAFYVHPHPASVTVTRPSTELSPAQPSASAGDLQRLFDVHRYTLHIPPECDGWFLSLEGVIDGVAKRSSGASVIGNTDVVLLARRVLGTRKVEYASFSEMSFARGEIDDPLAGGNITLDRTDGEVKAGDWLYRGGRVEVESGEHGQTADFEVRVTLRKPSN